MSAPSTDPTTTAAREPGNTAATMPTYRRHQSSDSWGDRPQSTSQHVPAATGSSEVTAAEFHSLPANIQRKFFSSHERLRFAEEQRLGQQVPPPTRDRQSRGIQLARSSLERDALDPSAPRRTRRLQKPQAARYENLARQHAEAQWYQNLPDKVQRQHFSREERIRLATRCESLPHLPRTPSSFDTHLPPAPAPLPLPLPVDRSRSRSRPRPQSRSRSVSPAETTSSLSTTVGCNDAVTVQRAISVRYFRPDDMASCFDPSYAKRARGPSSLSKRRTLSLGGASMAQSRSSTPSLLPSPLPQFTAGHRRNYSAAPRRSESSASTFDPNAVHYKDPEARAKLRTYLGSPQKFDEAIEFGFPSSQAAEPTSPAERPASFLAPLTLSHDVQSFMNDDWLPFMDSDGEAGDGEPGAPAESPDDALHDDYSIPDAPSPVTPGDHEEIYHRAQRMAISSSARHSTPSIPAQQQQHQQQQQQAPQLKGQPSFLNGYANGGFGMREMTLRLTLTRPDLRADEDRLYGWQQQQPQQPHNYHRHDYQPRRRDDPLALAELPVSDDLNGEMGPFGGFADRLGSSGVGGSSSSKSARRESKSLKRYFTIRKDRKILGYAVG